MIEALVAVSLSVSALAPLPQDPADSLRRAAERDARRYETLLRRRAPRRFGSSASPGACDEIIGRFCFHFDESDEPVQPDTASEHPDVREARVRAIRSHRAWFASQPSDPVAAGALVRYLIEAGRAREALAAARSHAWAAERSPASLLTLGLALHETASGREAEGVFDELLAAVEPEERDRLQDVEVLLADDERRLYRRLSPAGRAVYRQRLWALADPSLLEPGNERRAAHFARHAWAAILDRAPGAAGRTSWGRDSEEIVLRYGLPTRRERSVEPGRLGSTRLSMIEHYDPRAVPLVSTRLSAAGVPEAPEPGAPSAMEEAVVVSSYVPRSTPFMGPITVQATRIPVARGALLILSGRLEPDSAAPPPARPRGLVALLDTLGRELARAPSRIRRVGDSALVLDGQLAVPPGDWIYRMEVRDDSSGVAGLAQHPIAVPRRERLQLSDILVARPGSGASGWDQLAPTPGLVFGPGQPVTLWAEARGLARAGGESGYEVEWWVERREPGSVFGRAARWLGRRLGLLDTRSPVRLRWGEGASDGAVPLQLDVRLDLDPGMYRLGVRVRDPVSGRAAVSTRLIRIDPEAVPLGTPDPD